VSRYPRAPQKKPTWISSVFHNCGSTDLVSTRHADDEHMRSQAIPQGSFFSLVIRYMPYSVYHNTPRCSLPRSTAAMSEHGGCSQLNVFGPVALQADPSPTATAQNFTIRPSVRMLRASMAGVCSAPIHTAPYERQPHIYGTLFRICSRPIQIPCASASIDFGPQACCVCTHL
jgi:hypothetical protein